MTKSLVWFNPRILLKTDSDKLIWHRRWHQLTHKNICLVDNTGISKKYGNDVDMTYMADTIIKSISTPRNYENGQYWHNNFSELMTSISNSILDQLEPEAELRLSYSGGTDSCTALAALLSNSRIEPILKANKFIIYTTSYAKIEDPLIWKRIISMNIPLRLLDYDLLNKDQSKYLMVTGDGDGYGTLWQMMSDRSVNSDILFTDEEIFFDSFESAKSKLEKWFLSGEGSGLCWEFFQELMSISPNKIENIEQAWLWFENNLTAQCFMFRPSAYGVGDVKICPRSNWVWYMNDCNLSDMCDYESKNKLYPSNSVNKYQCLKYIADWMQWTDIKVKSKFYSQIKIPKLIRKNLIYSDLSYSLSEEI